MAINQRLRTKLQGINPQRIWRVIKRGFGFLGFGLRLRSKASGEKIKEKIDLTKNREKANQKPVRKVGNKPKVPEQGFGKTHSKNKEKSAPSTHTFLRCKG
ncbi:MAG: hypothetical protein ACK518_00820 [bacterium]